MKDLPLIWMLSVLAFALTNIFMGIHHAFADLSSPPSKKEGK